MGGDRSPPRTQRRAEGPRGRGGHARGRRARGRALDRGPHGREDRSPRHRPDPRGGPHGVWRAVLHDGSRPRHLAEGARPRGPAAHGARALDRAGGRGCDRRRARARRRPLRSQAWQRPPRRGGARACPRLRARVRDERHVRRGLPADARIPSVHVARADRRRAAHRGDGRLFARRRALRDAHRHAPLPRRDDRRAPRRGDPRRARAALREEPRGARRRRSPVPRVPRQTGGREAPGRARAGEAR